MARRFGRNQKRRLRLEAHQAEVRAIEAEKRSESDRLEAAKCVRALSETRRDVERLLGKHSAVLPATHIPRGSARDPDAFPGPLGEDLEEDGPPDTIYLASLARISPRGELSSMAYAEVRKTSQALHRIKVAGQVVIDAARTAMHVYVSWAGRRAKADMHVSPYYMSESATDFPSIARQFAERVGEEAFQVLIQEWDKSRRTS